MKERYEMKFNIIVEFEKETKEYKNIQAVDEKELRHWFVKSNIKGTLEEISRVYH